MSFRMSAIVEALHRVLERLGDHLLEVRVVVQDTRVLTDGGGPRLRGLRVRLVNPDGGARIHLTDGMETFFTTLDDLAGSREVRARYLPSEPPASTAVQVAALVLPEALIEVDVVAVVPA